MSDEINFNVVKELLDLLDHATTKDGHQPLRIQISKEDFDDLKKVSDFFYNSDAHVPSIQFSSDYTPRKVVFKGVSVEENNSGDLKRGEYIVYSEYKDKYTKAQIEVD